MTPEQLHDFCPDADRFYGALAECFDRFQIVTPQRQTAFLAQVAHESAAFKHLEENLNYSAEALVHEWPHHFDVSNAALYARQPEKIANRAYANRDGNGDEDSGDGWKYRGRGLFQLTGLANYAACSLALYNDQRLLQTPEDLLNPLPASLAAGWFWDVHRLNDLADQDTEDSFTLITRKINGGVDGLADRLAWRKRARQLWELK